MRKILYSTRFGAGWTTWEDDLEVKRLMLTYQPIIDAIERGEDLEQGLTFGEQDESKLHPALRQLRSDCRALGKEPPYVGGARGLVIRQVHGRVRIHEYDGNESIEEEGELTEWI